MMLPTHVLVGMVLALPFLAMAPDMWEVAVVAAILGSVLPDLDLYAGHRKTLHFPVYYSVLAAFAAVFALASPGVRTIGLAMFLIAAAVHSVSDILGGGLELRPWEATSEQAVYDHARKQWIAPRRVIPYDGAKEDLLLSVALAIPLLVLTDGLPLLVTTLAIVVGTIYCLVRRHLIRIATVLVGLLPSPIRSIAPARFQPETTIQ